MYYKKMKKKKKKSITRREFSLDLCCLKYRWMQCWSCRTKWVLFELLYLPNCFYQAAVEVAKYNVSCIFIFYYSVGFVCQVGPAFLIQQTLTKNSVQYKREDMFTFINILYSPYIGTWMLTSSGEVHSFSFMFSKKEKKNAAVLRWIWFVFLLGFFFWILPVCHHILWYFGMTLLIVALHLISFELFLFITSLLNHVDIIWRSKCNVISYQCNKAQIVCTIPEKQVIKLHGPLLPRCFPK